MDVSLEVSEQEWSYIMALVVLDDKLGCFEVLRLLACSANGVRYLVETADLGRDVIQRPLQTLVCQVAPLRPCADV